MKRRDLLTLLAGAAVATPSLLWPRVARAQQPDRMRRIGMLLSYAENDPEARVRIEALQQGLQRLGWTVGANIRIEYRWAADDPERMRDYARDLVGLQPDLIVGQSAPATTALRQVTSTIPIVAVGGIDLVAAGLVTSLSRPGGNITGFSAFEPMTSGKWLETLKEIAPSIARAMIIQNPENPNRKLYLPAIEAVARSLNVQLNIPDLRNDLDIDNAITEAGRGLNAGLIILPGPFTNAHRDSIVAMAARNRLPAVYPFRYFVASGGLISYGLDTVDIIRRSASYVDRILKGEKPGDLPVQQPTKFELVINLKTAQALGLTIPLSLQVAADEAIE